MIYTFRLESFYLNASQHWNI